MSRATELVEDAADRAERLMSISKAAALLGRDRGTLQAWVKKGMPVARKGDTGSAHMVDLKEVVAWREEVVRREERERFRGDDSEDVAGGYGVKMSPSDLLKLENLKLTRLKVGQAAGILVPAMVPEAAQERAFGILRQAMMAIPERITRSMAGFPEDRKLAWRAEAQGYVRSGLREAAKSVREAMPMIRVDFAGLDDPDDAA